MAVGKPHPPNTAPYWLMQTNMRPYWCGDKTARKKASGEGSDRLNQGLPASTLGEAENQSNNPPMRSTLRHSKAIVEKPQL